MSILSALLAGSYPPGVYRLGSRAGPAAIARAVERRGWHLGYIDGSAVADKESFLRAIAAAMRFPAYFGHNWDALEECLTDGSWAAAGGYVLLYDQAGRFATAQPTQWAVARAILEASVERWSTTPTPLYVLLRGLGRAAADLPRL